MSSTSILVLCLIILLVQVSSLLAKKKTGDRLGITLTDFNRKEFPFASCHLRAATFKGKKMSALEFSFGNNLRITENGSWLLAKTKHFSIEAQVTNSEITAIAAIFHHARVVVRVNSNHKHHFTLNEFSNTQKLFKDGYYKKIIRVEQRKQDKSTVIRLIAPDFVVHLDLFHNTIETVGIRVHTSTLNTLNGGICQHTDALHIKKVTTTSHFKGHEANKKQGVPIYVLNQDASSFNIPSNHIISAHEQPQHVDVVVVGGGMSGLGSATLISEYKDIKVLVIEKESYLGGLAAGTTTLDSAKNFHSRGAGYYSRPFEVQTKIMTRMGIPHWKNYEIYEPIDSYYYPDTKNKDFNPKKYYFEEMWGNKTVGKLPAPYGILNFILKSKELGEKDIANQPIERIYLEKKYYTRYLDKMDAKEWFYSLPCYIEKYYKEEGKELLERLEEEQGKFDCSKSEDEDDTRMAPLIDLMNLYSRSALGLHPENINAEALANFYWSEIQTRYTSPLGSKFAVNVVQQRLKSRPNVEIKMNSMVTSIEPMRRRRLYKKKKHGGAKKQNKRLNRVTYLTKGSQGQWIERVVYAKHVVYASHLGFAPQIIKGLKEHRPKQAKMMTDIEYVHYNVYVVTTKGHPWRDTYDLWLRDRKYKHDDPTDIILGRWQELNGYKNYRSFEKDPPGDGILAIYHPLPYEARKTPITNEQAASWAKKAISRAIEILQPLATAMNPTKDSRSNIEIKSIMVNRWPNSIHWVKKNHFKRAIVMKRSFNNIHFAHCTLGTPAFEEAIYRGYESAMNVLKAMGKIKKEYFADDGED